MLRRFRRFGRLLPGGPSTWPRAHEVAGGLCLRWQLATGRAAWPGYTMWMDTVDIDGYSGTGTR